MKKLTQTWVVVPCHSLEDFPTHYRDEDAENLLACWTAIWHPALIAATGKSPMWLQADSGPPEEDSHLIVVPQVAKTIFSDAGQPAAEPQNTTIDATNLSREQIIEQLLQHLPSIGRAAEKNLPDSREVEAPAETNGDDMFRREPQPPSMYSPDARFEAGTESGSEPVAPEVAADFLALGYAYLQIQIMTRQLRYSSNLDEHAFEQNLVAAAGAAMEHDSETVTEKLTACFDLLLEEKSAYYPVQPELIDLVLVADTTLGKSLARQLESTHRLNLLLTGKLTRQLADSHPETLAVIRGRVADETLFVAGGLENELPDPLISSETMVRQFQLAKVAFQELLDCQPEIFVRRRFGLTTSTPGLLKQAGFTGAIHATLDDGQFPQSPNTVMRWTGNDEASLLALGIPPLDASDAGALLRLGLGIGEQIDSSHTATVVFAHWPGRVCDSFNDLLRIAKWAPLLGEFTRLNEYFDSAYDPGFSEDFTADQYRDPFLQQAVAAQAKNPISRFVDYWRCHYQLAGCTAMLAQCVSAGDVARVPPGGGQPAAASKLREDLWSRVSELSKRLDAVVDAANAEVWDAINDEISRLENSVANQIATAVGTGYFFNPTNHKQRIRHSTPSNRDLQIKDTGPIVFADTGAGQTDWVIEVPGMGFASGEAQAGNQKQPDPFRRDPPVLQDHVLRNEFFELHIDEQTGGIRSLQVYGGRNNLLSQQLAARLPQREQNEHSPDADSGRDAGKSTESRGPRLTKTRYTTMVADEIETVASCRIHGSIISKGRLLDGDQTVARFTQTVSLSRGIPIAEVEIALEPLIEMSDSINHYFCNRMAWKDESSSVVSNDLENEQAVISDWFLGTHYININQDDHAVTMLTGGLPFHRRVSRRMIDSLLIVGQEQRRTFRLGLGVDVRYPLMTATQWMSPAAWVAAGANPAEPNVKRNDPQGWFFHFDCRNVMATWWEPIFAEVRFAEGKGSEIVGVQIRMRETLGRPGRLTLRCPHPIATAERRSLAGESLQTVPVDESNAERAIIDFAAWEYFQIAIRW